MTGALLIGDVGYDAYEEIDLLPLGTAGGTNFGWRNYEGLHLRRSGQPALANAVAPIHEYPHTDASDPCSITGGYVVRDPSVPELAGRYVYADYCAGWVRSLNPTAPAASDDRQDVAAEAARGLRSPSARTASAGSTCSSEGGPACSPRQQPRPARRRAARRRRCRP